ncbi:hypothetical protein [Alicyclobacillus dauci]|uniref:Uncharacterized protein n=1 Tax=Alicyclobacillus dauci TaxID=1475485 RepID=A0ABY6YXD7_9BACL|nr:hypothetical protein [Alicyclobacillus dauci]WAH35049.1 hypothetical protein NZD86_11990 [Alicyclobacillus dauci]
MGKDAPIKDALGLGERLSLGGAHIDCVPATLADLDDAMKHWHTWAQGAGSVQMAYLPGNEEAKEAFEELLYIACGRKIEKDELRAKVNVADGAKEVVAFIDRFLGFKPRDAAGTESTQG